MTVRKGGCACGGVRYESRGAPVFSFHCHCRQCQYSTGGGHSSAFVVSEAETMVTGAISFFEHRVANGNLVSRGFCATCGSPVMNRNSGYPENLYIHAATLDDPSLFNPERAIFVDEAQPWDQVDASLIA